MEYLEHQGDWASLERKFNVTLDTTRLSKSLGLSPEEAARCVGLHQACLMENGFLHFLALSHMLHSLVSFGIQFYSVRHQPYTSIDTCDLKNVQAARGLFRNLRSGWWVPGWGGTCTVVRAIVRSASSMF